MARFRHFLLPAPRVILVPAMNPRDLFLKQIKAGGPTSSDGLPLLSLEDFFTGNRDLGSIGCNLGEHPGIEVFFKKLAAIRSRPDVYEVLVGITDTNENDPDPLCWPFSDRIYITTSGSMEDVERWTKALSPTQVVEEQVVPRLSLTASDRKMYCVWWD